MPLGSAAQYGNPACDANIDSTVGTPWINAAKFSIPIYSSATTDPVVPIYVDNMQWSSAKTPATAQPSNDSLEPATRSRAGHTAAPRLPA
ncbi:MAG: hypothetical protein QOI75_7006 [Pseudonocardiales bacterium]|nr:hypothetical protein [Pseudonocardiales bacterium]